MICDSIPMEEEAEGRRYRYWLHRELVADGEGGLVFVLLNPSTADALEDDPTIRRCVGFGKRWGYRELTVVNLFAMRATSPAVLRQHGAAAIGSRTDDALRWARSEPRTRAVVAGWGNHGMHLERDVAAMDIVRPTMALRTTKLGCPAHPLYLPSASEPQPYEGRKRTLEEGKAAAKPLSAVPVPVRRALAKLGADLREARLRRRIPMALLAERASISRTTLTNIERGDGGVALGNYARALFALGLLDRLAEVADVRYDETGLAIASEQLPKRVRQRRSWR